jgi:8-oxo-dGTP pyrophosphatase MutT (NUDIX family)
MVPAPRDKEVSAGVIVYRDTEEGIKFLVLYHGHNYWNFPKGKIEEGETAPQAALRETEEETGVPASSIRLITGFQTSERFTFKKDGKMIDKIVTFCLGETTVKDVVLKEYHQGYGWFTFAEARRMMGGYKDSQRALRHAYDYLRAEFRKKNPDAHPQSSSWQGRNIRRPRPSRGTPGRRESSRERPQSKS